MLSVGAIASASSSEMPRSRFSMPGSLPARARPRPPSSLRAARPASESQEEHDDQDAAHGNSRHPEQLRITDSPSRRRIVSEIVGPAAGVTARNRAKPDGAGDETERCRCR